MKTIVLHAARPRPSRCVFYVMLVIALFVLRVYAEAETEPEAQPATLPEHWKISYIEESVFNSKVFVAEVGNHSKPTVLLIHGLAQAGLMDWLPVIPALAEHYHVLAIDLPGFGRSDKARGKYSPTNYARVIQQIKTQYSNAPIAVVGHSLGGAVALRYAAMFPPDVQNLVLVDVAGILERTAFVKHSAQAFIADTDVPLVFEGVKQLAERFAGKVVDYLGNTPDPGGSLGNYEVLWETLLGDKAIVNAGLALVNENFSSAIFSLPHKTSLIWGSNDEIAPLRTGKLLEQQLGNARLNIINGAGHVPMATHTTIFNNILLTALAENSSAIPPTAKASQALNCRNENNKTYSGNYTHVSLENCQSIKLENVTSNSLMVKASQVEMENVSVVAKATAAVIDNSVVVATNVRLQGKQGVVASDSRIDFAGANIEAEDIGVSVKGVSEVIFSISRMTSAKYKGNVHGYYKLENDMLDYRINQPN